MKNLLRPLAPSLLIFFLLAQPGWAQVGNNNPTGVTGEYNGSVTTAGSYDPYTGNAKRFVDDLTVTGSLGAYPLKWTRVLNTRSAAQWSHSYAWGLWLRPYHDYHYFPDQYEGPGGALTYPDGRTLTFALPEEPYTYLPASNGTGPMDWLAHVGNGNYDLLMHDGGKVKFRHPAGSTSLRVEEIVDPHGLTTTLIYDGAGRLWQIVEPGGRYLQINYTTYSRVYDGDTLYYDLISSVQAYSAPGQLTETVTYNYNTAFVARITYIYLTQANYDDGTHAVYTYQDGLGNTTPTGLIGSCDDVRFAGPMKRIKYDYEPNYNGCAALGQIKRERNLTTNQIVSEVTYPPCGTPDMSLRARRTETRGDGTTREFQYNPDWTLSDLQSYTDFKNQPSYISYGPGSVGNYIEYRTDARGKTTAIEKDGYSDAVKTITHPDGKRAQFTYTNYYYLASRTDERDKPTSFTRDPNTHRITRTEYPDGGYETFTYNGFGQILTHRMTSGGTETFVYDEGLPPRGLKTSSYPPPTESDPDPWNHPTRYYYYQSGPNTDRLRVVVDPRGNATAYEYNQRSQVTKVQHQDWTYSQSGYNPDGTLAWTADENHPGAATDPTQRTRYTYDEYKRVLTVTNPMNETTETSYAIDPAWANPLLHTTASMRYVISPGGKNTVFGYDENFRKTYQASALGTADEAWTLFDYDEVGNLKSVQDPRGKVTAFGYDDRNRRTSTTNPAPFNNEITRSEYDEVGNLTKEIRPDLSFRRVEYDSMNRVIDTYGFGTEHTQYDRDLAGNVWRIIDAKTAAYGFSYDALNRKINATYPTDATNTNRTEHWWYDVAGNLNVYKDQGEQYKYLLYDNRNRLTDTSWNWGGGPHVVTGYDDASRLSSVVTRNADTDNIETTVAFGYDGANRQVWEDQTLAGYPTRRVETPRDADGNRVCLQAPGYYIGYGYTQRNQLASVNGFATFQYDKNGNMINRQGTWIYPNNTNFTYDELNRVSQAEQGGASGWIFESNHYRYDNLSREIATWRDTQGNKGERFGYNPIGQLTGADYNADQVWNGNALNPSLTVSYNVSALNRNSVTENGASVGYASNGMNQYTSVGGTALTYEGNFNLASFNGATYNYNSINQLTSASNNGNSAQLTYDGLGRCVRRTVNGVTRLFTYDGWKPMLEWDQSGNWVAWNIYGAGPDEILARYDSNGRVIIYKQDKHGNVAALLDQYGNVSERYIYDAFGKPKMTDQWGNERSQTDRGNRFMFQGREWIPELGIYDYRNRMYHPGIGRFLQIDPMGFGAGDMNLFRYCGDDPVDHSDPTGLIAVDTIWSGLMWMQGNSLASFDQLLQIYQLFQPAGVQSSAVAPKDEGVKQTEVQSSRVVITQQQIEVDRPGDDRAGWTPNPKENSFVSTKATAPDKLELTYHLRVLSYLNTARGPQNQAYARKREPDHTNDFYAAKDIITLRALSLLGRRFDTRTEAALALRSAVDPKVDRVFFSSYSRWDLSGQHYPQENGRYLNRDE